MKKRSSPQPDLRPYTRTFFRGNRLNFGLALIDVFLSAAINLLISWLLQQIVDLIGGSGTVFSLRQLALIAALVIAVPLVLLRRQRGKRMVAWLKRRRKQKKGGAICDTKP